MDKIIITYNGLLVPESIMGSIKDFKKLLAYMTVKEKQVRRNVSVYSAPVIRRAYKGIIIDSIRYFIFPRIFILKLLEINSELKNCIIDNTLIDNELINDSMAIFSANEKYISDKVLYPYQDAAVEYIYEQANKRYGVLYLQMDTGLGKSRVGCAFIAKVGKRALIVSPTKAIAEQWWNEAKEMYPNLNVNIYKNNPLEKNLPSPHANNNIELKVEKTESKVRKTELKVRKTKPKKESPPSDIDIIIVNTFREKDENFIKNYSVIILDEAHEYHSACNLKALWLSQTKYVLGLSATPLERPDGLDRYITLHLGDVIYPKDIPNFDVSSVNFKANVKIIEYEGCEPYIDTVLTPAGTISSIMTINNILNDPYRLSLVVQEINHLNNVHLTEEGIAHGLIRDDLEHPKKHGVFVFVETRDFLIKLRNALLENMDASNILVPQLEDDECVNVDDIADANVDDIADANGDDIADANEANDADGANEADGANGANDADEADEADDADEADGADMDNIANENTTPISILRGGITKQTFNDARDAKAHIVLTTYGYSRRGISLPDMTALVLVSPRRNGSRQIIGRILRRNSDESIIRQIVDIVDVHTVLKGQSNERVKIYKEKFGKQNVKKIGIKWNKDLHT